MRGSSAPRCSVGGNKYRTEVSTEHALHAVSLLLTPMCLMLGGVSKATSHGHSVPVCACLPRAICGHARSANTAL